MRLLMGIMSLMSDEKKAEKKQAGTIDGAPMGFVKGGTSTTASENLYEARYQEAEARRDAADAEKRIASTPIEQGGGQMHVSQMTQHPEIPKAYIPLVYVDGRGQPVVIGGQETICQADLIIGMDPARPMELTLIIICPRCQQRGHKHLQDCQLTIRQSNKHFEFRAGMGPPTFVMDGKTYKSAGMIVESEPFTCSDCDWRARIDHNRVWPD